MQRKNGHSLKPTVAPVLLATILLSIAIGAQAAKLYKWKDADGGVHFSQTPPQNQQDQDSEEVSIKDQKKGDLRCCVVVRQLIEGMLARTIRGGSGTAQGIEYSKLGIDVAEIENFITRKISRKTRPGELGKTGFSTCMNAGFKSCRAGSLPSPRGHGGPEEFAPNSLSGSGFFVSSRGYILTNNHVAGNCKTITIQPQGIEARLVAADKALDLALIRIDGTSPPPAHFRTNAPELGEEVIAAGFPYKGILSSDIKITTGNISSLSGVGNDRRVIQITASIQPGNSGGPLIDRYGNVVGVIVSKLDSKFMLERFQDIPQNINFAIKGHHIKQFLQENDLNFKQSNAEAKQEVTTISKAAQAYTVAIECQNPAPTAKKQ